MNFEEMTEQALQFRSRYAELEEKQYRRAWRTEEIALGFMGDVGDQASSCSKVVFSKVFGATTILLVQERIV
jgi:hypothetical protein